MDPTTYELTRRLTWQELNSGGPPPAEGHDAPRQREWLVTNGLGGYASGTVSGALTRRFHGLLIAALPAPLGRVLMLSHLSARARLPGGEVYLLDAPPGAAPAPRSIGPAGPARGRQGQAPQQAQLLEFRLAGGLPVWRYQTGPFVIEKLVVLPHRQNTSYVLYRRVDREPAPLRLKLQPALALRRHDGRVDQPLSVGYHLTAVPAPLPQRREPGTGYELRLPGPLPALRLLLYGDLGALTFEPGLIRDVYYQLEHARGYDYQGDLYTPGYFRVDLGSGEQAALVASTEPWEMMGSLQPSEALQQEHERRRRLRWLALAANTGDSRPPAARAALAPAHLDEDLLAGPAAELVLAADQFLITPAGRVADAARAYAAGDEVRTVIAGYHWFTDWGRDTMISLEGLTLATGRHAEAAYLLRTFAHYVQDGLIPNLFPEGERAGLYHTADATLWFFHAVDRYVSATADYETLQLLLPVLCACADHHLRGTRFGIGVDPRDGLLRQGEEGYQLTWMDAKVGDWVVTPRRGKAVELNALWYNALRLLAGWLRQGQGGDGERAAGAAPPGGGGRAEQRAADAARARGYEEHAARAWASFNARFPCPGGYLYDVVDGERGDDAACRPNQLLSFSLRHPILEPARWAEVLAVVQERLLTPVGLRTLSPDHPDYKPTYDGDLRARDAAYHQGTVWAWLIGPFIDAWLRVHPDDRAGARRFLLGFAPHLSEACIGSVSEIFDAEPPFHPRGCAAQAWSVAEVLRAWLKTAP